MEKYAHALQLKRQKQGQQVGRGGAAVVMRLDKAICRESFEWLRRKLSVRH